ncbi:hypothetical protein HDU98_007263 [Podochytrium sp. JEL0797]|nr:hypothetical protein HDU98_007263 [Podochytrium sp. JEL0797]
MSITIHIQDSFHHPSTSRTNLTPAPPPRPTHRRGSIFAGIQRMEELKTNEALEVLAGFDWETEEITKIKHIQQQRRKMNPSIQLENRDLLAEADARRKQEDKLIVGRTLEHIKAAGTVYFKNGMEMWTRETQTTELDDLDFGAADRIARAMKKDMDVIQAVIKLNSDAKVQKAELILCSLMSQKLKTLQASNDEKIRALKKQLKARMESEIFNVIRDWKVKAEAAYKELREIHLEEYEKRHDHLAIVKEAFDEKNLEYQSLKYRTARIFLTLKQKNVPGLPETSDQICAERQLLVNTVAILRTSITECEDEIRHIHTKLFKLFEDFDKSGIQRPTSRKTKFASMSEETGAEAEEGTENLRMADAATREIVRVKIVDQFESFLHAETSDLENDLFLAQKKREKVVSGWETRIKSIETLFDEGKRNQLLREQSRVLKWAGKVMMDRIKKRGVDSTSITLPKSRLAQSEMHDSSGDILLNEPDSDPMNPELNQGFFYSTAMLGPEYAVSRQASNVPSRQTSSNMLFPYMQPLKFSLSEAEGLDTPFRKLASTAASMEFGLNAFSLHSRVASSSLMPEEMIHLGWAARPGLPSPSNTHDQNLQPVEMRRGSFQPFHYIPGTLAPQIEMIQSQLEQEYMHHLPILENQGGLQGKDAILHPEHGFIMPTERYYGIEDYNYLIHLNAFKKRIVKGLAGVDIPSVSFCFCDACFN